MTFLVSSPLPDADMELVPGCFSQGHRVVSSRPGRLLQEQPLTKYLRLQTSCKSTTVFSASASNFGYHRGTQRSSWATSRLGTMLRRWYVDLSCWPLGHAVSFRF